MEKLDSKRSRDLKISRLRALLLILGIVALIAAVFLTWSIASASARIPVLIVAGIVFTVCVILTIFLLMNPDAVRATQTDSMLQMSSNMVDLLSEGMTNETAMKICEMLLSRTAAIAVAITNTESILGYVGYRHADYPQGAPIRTQATHDAIADGKMRIIYNPEGIGLPNDSTMIRAAIVVPLRVGERVVGTLKFYYRKARKITATQKSIAEGFGRLISTQIASIELEEQRELATAMELRMLQSQINPHFLFNTINTIASLIRTDPASARTLLREFAVFYRSTLENSQDLIPLSREVEQTQRYFSFEVARFGDDRLGMMVDLTGDDIDVGAMQVPPFIIQPIVENAVKHAMPAEGRLTVGIHSSIEGHDVLLAIHDDGVGMDEETRNNIFTPKSQTGLGIAITNVHDRLFGHYGERAEMKIESEVGQGTLITLRFPDMIYDNKLIDDEKDSEE